MFRNRRGDRLKILCWDGSGYCLYYKRLEQGTFPFPILDEDAAANETAPPESAEKPEPKGQRPVLRPPPSHLPREDQHLDIDTGACDECGGELHTIGEAITEQLDYRPAIFFVISRLRLILALNAKIKGERLWKEF